MSEKVVWNGEFGEKCNLPYDCIDCDITECPGRTSEITTARIYAPFLQRFKEPMLNGTKNLTTRAKRLGIPGDAFEQFGELFIIVAIAKKPLAFSAENWKREGCNSREDFLKLWKQLHPRKKVDLKDEFWVHKFKLLRDVVTKYLK